MPHRSPAPLPALLALIAAAVLLTGCDSLVSYSVVNETDEPLLSWLLKRDCSDLIGGRTDYDYKREVPPRSEVEVSDVTGPLPDAMCVQVTTDERRLVLSEPYIEGEAYVVREPLTLGPHITEPGKSFAGRVGGGETGAVAALVIGVLLLSGSVYIAWRVARARRRAAG